MTGKDLASSDGSHLRLRSLDLQGYKTFASKTEIVLAPTITAVVGPNGTGKSNIADAIRWVLGEQSYSLLRGKRTEDMIFSGSETRSRASMALATITFDNSDGWLPIDFTEVSISRRAYRDGQNEYLLNGQRVRLRDVTELLARSGLAQRTYTIIGQGLVDAALSLKADERRRLFEEAAGIGLYRSRREEALRRLQVTRRNLDRLQDIMTELQPRLRSLIRQVERTRQYEQVAEDLDAVLRIWYGYHWYNLSDIVTSARRAVEREEGTRDGLREEQAAAELELSDTSKQIGALRVKLQAWNQQLSVLNGEREAFGRRLAVAQERIQWLGEQETLVKIEIASLEKAKTQLTQHMSQVVKEADLRRQEYADAEAGKIELEQDGEVELSQRHTHFDRVLESRLKLESLIAEQATNDTQRSNLAERLQTIRLRLDETTSEIDASKAALADAQRESQNALADLKTTEGALKMALEEQSTTQQALSRAESELSQQRTVLAEHMARSASLKAQLLVMRARSDAIEHVAGKLSNAVEAGALGGMAGRLGEHFNIKSEHRVAIMAALGDFSDGLAFITTDDLVAALNWLEGEGESPRIAFTPLAGINPPSLLPAPSERGCLGNAATLVRVSEKYQPAIDLLLGQTLLVDNHKSARKLLRDLPPQARLVTLRGDVYFPTGQVLISGSDPVVATQEAVQINAAALDEEIASATKLKIEADQLFEEIGDLRRRLNDSQQVVEQMREKNHRSSLGAEQIELTVKLRGRELTQLVKQQSILEHEIEALSEERDLLEDQGKNHEDEHSRLEDEMQAAVASARDIGPGLEMAKAEARIEVAQFTISGVDQRKEDLKLRLTTLEVGLEEWVDRLERTQSEQEAMHGEVKEAQDGFSTIEKQVASLLDQIEPTDLSLITAEEQRDSLEAEERQMRSQLRFAERQYSQAQIEIARRKEELVNLKRRIEDDFGLVKFDDNPGIAGQEPLPLEGLVERLPRIEQLPQELETQVNDLRAQLRRVGAVNPEAKREYEEVKGRVEFLSSQVDDLREAESQIREIIGELDLLMEREFRKTFDSVSVAFRQAFMRLFGGGSARLVLTYPEDLALSGIDIEARLPGRREQGLAVLSGGERSLTACALIFALLKVSPPPFCVLDEVDAMLDEVNVLRFCEMLRELSQDTQFVVITHNRLTIQAAEVIYGVSIGSDSASRVISLKLEEAEEQIAA